jgi:hypothetical protein
VLALTRNDLFNVYSAATTLADYNPADDLAAYEAGLSALAINRAREARRIFGELFPNYGALQSRPEFYLHYAAAYHILGNHSAELAVVRDGRMARPRTIAVRLATCRLRAALGKEDNARIALDQLAAGDTDTTGVMSLGYAFEDCAAELDAHGFPVLAKRAHDLANGWFRHRPRPPVIIRDTTYEKGYVRFERAREHMSRGELRDALNSINDAFYGGFPYYEQGRVMLHADTTFRRLRNTRGFLYINQPRG